MTLRKTFINFWQCSLAICYYNEFNPIADTDATKDRARCGPSTNDQHSHHSSSRVGRTLNEVTVLETSSTANDSVNKIATDLL